MQLQPDSGLCKVLVWWVAVMAVVVALKHHYSIATAAELEWVFRPLSLLLEWFSGHAFYRDSNHEWVSESANVRLVKACAGINFMLMSFMAYAWTFRPDRYETRELWSWMAGRIMLLCAAFVAAWATCLLANSLRIIVAMAVSSHDAGLHRLIGMVIYVPLLSLQLSLGDRRDHRISLAGPALLYVLLMVLIPLLTGNAFRHPALFLQHLLFVSTQVAVMCVVFYLCRDFKRRRSVRKAAKLKGSSHRVLNSLTLHQ
jgi:exosortase K